MFHDPNAAPLSASLLDRLLEDSATPPARGRGQVLRDLKQAVRRDLERLLNARQACWQSLPEEEEEEELQQSLATYGLPDFTGENLGDPQNLQAFQHIIEQTIRRFEPRFSSVRVMLLQSDAPDHTLRFRIDAVLDSEAVSFASTLEPANGSIVVDKAMQ